MAKRIEEVKRVDASAAAQTVDVGFRPFLIANTTASDPIYFKEKEEDGVDCTSSNGFPVAAGKMVEAVLTAQKLSVIGGTVAILFLREA